MDVSDDRGRGFIISCLVSILCLPVLVNAGAPSKGAKTPAVSRVTTAVLRVGSDYIFSRNLGQHLGLPQDSPSKVVEVLPEASSDGLGHAFDVIVDTSNAKAKPTCLILLSRENMNGRGLSHYFKLNLDGTLENAFLAETKLDEFGKPIRGSGVATPLDFEDPKVRSLLRTELDFWLKRYPPPPAKRPRPDPR